MTTAGIATLFVRLVALGILIPGLLVIPVQLLLEPSAFSGRGAINLVGVLVFIIPGVLLYRSSARVGRWLTKGVDDGRDSGRAPQS